ncbi:MAG TPA: DUF1697 domain-containing protein [Moheibacter sp.]|nr:DUF1697 domain-containing protein [Moheibacter sp.]
MTYIALLRGINVSGHKIIKMELLRKMLENLNFENVRTYIQSGNVVFKTSVSSISEIEKRIKDGIQNEFGFEVYVKVLTPKELNESLDKNPFLKDDSLDLKQHYFAFLDQIPIAENWEILKNLDLGREKIEVDGKVLFVHYTNGAGKSKLSNSLIESKLKLKSTMRNLNTVHKLIEMTKSELNESGA